MVSCELTAYLSIFKLFKLNELWPYYKKHLKQTILNCATLKILALQIFKAFVPILLIVNLSLNQTLLTFLCCVRQTWMAFFVRGYLPLIQKDSSTHMHGLAVYVKEGLLFAQNLSLENSADFYFCFQLALLHSVSYFFFIYQSTSSSSCMVFVFVHSFLFFFI